MRGTENLRRLGRYLRSFLRASFAPFFIVAEDDIRSDPMDTIEITEWTIDQMDKFATFQVNEPTIRISNQNAKTAISLALRHEAGSLHVPSGLYPISGFPRQLKKEDEVTCESCHALH